MASANSAAVVAGTKATAGGSMASASAAGSGGAGSSGSTGSSGSSGAAGASGSGAATPATVQFYEERGPYTVKRLDNQGKGTLQGATGSMFPANNKDDPSAFTVYYPENSDGQTFPLITWGNGTYVVPAYYDELIEHIVSHGFVVVGANDSQVGSGTAMLAAVDWATAQSTDMSSPLFGKIAANHVGATGQSQGGSGTCAAGLDAKISAIAPLSGVPLDGGSAFVSGLKIPVFFVNSANEDAGSTMVKDFFDRVKVPAIYGVTAHGDHNGYGDIVDDPMAGIGGPADDARESRGAITAWFDWQLRQKDEVRPLFIGPDCGFCTSSKWKTILTKGF